MEFRIHSIQKGLTFLLIPFCLLFCSKFNAQSLQLLDVNNNIIENTTHYEYLENGTSQQSSLGLET